MINKDGGVCVTDNFSSEYPLLNQFLVDNGKEQKSRYGDTKELIDFKLVIKDPLKRCVGGFGRDTNIFFLLAEALWIWAGRSDVEFLTIFNSRMSEFSDNGQTFHAPYGFRLRKYGNNSDSPGDVSLDQVAKAIEMLAENLDDRRVVMGIWDPFLDLGVKSLDLPCNDLVFLKIRDGKLITTIANRSNDIAWGLGTNVFQFSFITELMVHCIGDVELGTQTHNIQSLHYYLNNSITDEVVKNWCGEVMNDLYDIVKSVPFDFNHYEFVGKGKTYKDKLGNVDETVKRIIKFLLYNYKTGDNDYYFERDHESICKISVKLGKIFYLLYKFIQRKKMLDKDADGATWRAIQDISNHTLPDDYTYLALNWLIKRIKNKNLKEDAVVFVEKMLSETLCYAGKDFFLGRM